MAVTHSDRAEGSVALEVTLMARGSQPPARIRLGVQPVARAGRTVVRFLWKTGSVLPAVDEIRVDFLLAGRRIHRSAQVAIESFRFMQ